MLGLFPNNVRNPAPKPSWDDQMLSLESCPMTFFRRDASSDYARMKTEPMNCRGIQHYTTLCAISHERSTFFTGIAHLLRTEQLPRIKGWLFIEHLHLSKLHMTMHTTMSHDTHTTEFLFCAENCHYGLFAPNIRCFPQQTLTTMDTRSHHSPLNRRLQGL